MPSIISGAMPWGKHCSQLATLADASSTWHPTWSQHAGRMVEHMQNLLPASKFRPIVNIGQAASLVQCTEANIEYSWCRQHMASRMPNVGRMVQHMPTRHCIAASDQICRICSRGQNSAPTLVSVYRCPPDNGISRYLCDQISAPTAQSGIVIPCQSSIGQPLQCQVQHIWVEQKLCQTSAAGRRPGAHTGVIDKLPNCNPMRLQIFLLCNIGIPFPHSGINVFFSFWLG